MTQKQGIVAILGSENQEKMARVASLRRTLSADMTSKKWSAQHDFSFSPPTPSLKKVASSEHIANLAPRDSSSDDEEDGYVVNTKAAAENPRRLDNIWTSILSQNAQADNPTKLPPPYIHPLAKKSTGSLSKNSLEVCTESLGSETGSDVFSSRSSSDENKGTSFKQQQQQHDEKEDVKDLDVDGDQEPKVVIKHSHVTLTKKAQQARPLPPPLPSLATAHTDGPSLHVHSHRVNGRLVLEAVSVPLQQKYFESQRHHGRFLLTLINDPKDEEPLHQEKAQEHETNEDEDDEEKIMANFDDKDIGISKGQARNPTVGGIKLHKLAVTLKKTTERDNMNLPWSSSRLNHKIASSMKLAIVDEQEAAVEVVVPPPPTRATSRVGGLPPLPPAATTTCFNSYEYLWRAKPSMASVIDPLITQHNLPTKNKTYEQDMVLVRGNKADCLLPSLKGCMEPRRSLLMWEPFCIATS